MTDPGAPPPEVCVVPLPGNHDCDFSGPTNVPRDIVIAAIKDNPETAKDPAVQRLCTEVQKPYGQFLQDLQARGLTPAPTLSDPLRTAFLFGAPGWTLHINCYNSAWLSKKKELPGSLVFPPTLAIDAPSDPKSVVISALHHPFNWLEPTNARAVYSALTTTSDLILTGHEHVSDSRGIVSAGGAQFRHSEASALRDPLDPQSGFHIYVIDPGQRLHRYYDFEFEDERYEPIQKNADYPLTQPQWEEFFFNKLRTKGHFALSEKHRDFLDDVGVTLIHSNVGALKLSDIYVYPDLFEITLHPNVLGKQIPGAKCRDFLRNSGPILVTGDSLSGKTSLAKSLCYSFYMDQDVPIFLSPPGKIQQNKAASLVEEAFSRQYSPADLTAFRQLERSRKVIVVDDVQRGAPKGTDRSRLLRELHSITDRIIFIADDLSVDLQDLTEPGENKTPQYRIQQFGYLHRNELVEKWLSLTDEEDAVTLARKTTEVTRRIDEVVGRRGYIPAYPAYVLSLLQAAESAVPFDSSASTHGHYYEIFIRAALLKGNPKQQQLDVLMGYLAFVAFSMFRMNSSALSHAELEDICKRYVEKVAVSLNHDALISELTTKHIFVTTNDHVSFSYRYIYYYFVASYLRDNITDVSVKAIISELCNSTQKKANADILLFLAHLSKDPFIVNELVKAAGSHYVDQPELTLSTSEGFWSETGDIGDELIYEEKDVNESRREVAIARDSAIRTDEEQFDGIEVVAKLASALRTLQILGQVLKNYPGHLDADTKFALARAGFGVGARSWHWVLKLMRDNQVDMAKELLEFFRAADPGERFEALAERARDTIVALARLCSFGLVKRIGEALGAPELAAIYKRLDDDVKSDAIRVVLTGISLAHSPVTPEAETLKAFENLRGNLPAHWLLRQLVLDHFMLFPVDMRTKQRLCQKLGIKYRSGLGAGKETKLLK